MATPCPVKRRLISELSAVHATIVSVHNRELEAVMRADFEVDAPLTAQLEEARQRRISIMRELKEHASEHRCL